MDEIKAIVTATRKKAVRREAQRQSGVRIRARRKAFGVCRTCGVRMLGKHDRSSCRACRDRKKVRIAELKRKVFDHYGWTCSCCGEDRTLFLTIDHVNNDGKEHRKRERVGSIYRWLVKKCFPAAFRVLCFNCNMGRYMNGGVCPHKDQSVPKICGVMLPRTAKDRLFGSRFVYTGPDARSLRKTLKHVDRTALGFSCGNCGRSGHSFSECRVKLPKLPEPRRLNVLSDKDESSQVKNDSVERMSTDFLVTT